MRLFYFILSLCTLSLTVEAIHSADETLRLYNPDEISTVFSTLGTLNKLHKEGAKVEITLVAIGNDTLSPEEVYPKLLDQFQLPPGAASSSIKDELSKVLKCAKESYKKAPDVALGDVANLETSMQNLAYTSPLCNRVRANRTPREWILEKARALAEDNFWYFHHLSKENVSYESLDPTLAEIFTLSANNDMPYLKNLMRPVIRYFSNNMADIWEDALRRLNRYQVPGEFDFVEIRKHLKQKKEYCKDDFSFSTWSPKDQLKDILTFILPELKERDFCASLKPDIRKKISDKKMPSYLSKFEKRILEFLSSSLLGRAQEDLTTLYNILGEAERASNEIPKKKRPKKKKAPKPTTDPTATSAAKTEPNGDAPALTDALEERPDGEAGAPTLKAQATPSGEEEAVTAPEPSQAMAISGDEIHEVTRPAAAAAASAAASASPLIETTPLENHPSLTNLKKKDFDLLRDLLGLNSVKYIPLMEMLEKIEGIDIEKTQLGCKIWGITIDNHVEMVNTHRPHHEGKTLHRPSQVCLRKLLWAMGISL